MATRRRLRRKTHGDFKYSGLMQILIAAIELWTGQGKRQSWREYRMLSTDAPNPTVGELLTVTHISTGEILFKPNTKDLPMGSREAHLFRDLCLNMLANYPELVGRRQQGNVLTVQHQLEDKHHVFEIKEGQAGVEIQHTLGDKQGDSSM